MTMKQHDIRDNLPREHGFEPLKVEGQLPSYLKGTLFRNGPGISERFGAHFDHVFEADGAISAVRFDGEQAQGAVRLVETPEYLEEKKEGRFLYGGQVSWLRRMLNTLRGKRKSPMNVNVMHWNGRLYALSDGAIPFALDKDNLAGLGEEDFEGLVVGAHSAHPHWLESRRTLYNFSMIYGQKTEIEVYAFPVAERPQKIARVPISGITYVHDFIVTEGHIVFFLSPVRVNVWRSLLQWGGLGEMLQWKPEFGTEIVIIPIDSPEKYTRFETDPFFQWHFANAFEQDGNIVVDYVRHRDFSTLSEINREEMETKPEEKLHRAVVNPTQRSFETFERWGGSCEFPSVSRNVTGQDAQYLWMVGFENERQGLVKVEAGTDRATHVPVDKGQLVSEPIFVPRPGAVAEDDGAILMLTYDDSSHRSFVGVYNGLAPEEGPQARVWFDHHIPTTFHGTWVDA
jgi:all-trans-8'-apo-beta-carotenal 15,15'-oxygenase